MKGGEEKGSKKEGKTWSGIKPHERFEESARQARNISVHVGPLANSKKKTKEKGE